LIVQQGEALVLLAGDALQHPLSETLRRRGRRAVVERRAEVDEAHEGGSE
jgi:hypothetical protein